MNAMLLRVAIDKGAGGTWGPIFSDGSFEYIPIPEGDPGPDAITYNQAMGRHGKPLNTYLPPVLHDSPIHFDPEFESFTYGDPTRKRNSLVRLDPGDILAFYGAPAFRDGPQVGPESTLGGVDSTTKRTKRCLPRTSSGLARQEPRWRS